MHIVHTEADGGKGGQPLRIINESLGMIQRGHQVTLLCPETAPLHALARNAGLTVVTMPLKRKNLKNLQVLRRWMKDNRHSIDVINSHNSADTAGGAGESDAVQPCTTGENPSCVRRTAQQLDDPLALPHGLRAYRDHRRGAAPSGGKYWRADVSEYVGAKRCRYAAFPSGR